MEGFLADPAIWASLALGYLIGSIPFGILLTRLAGLGDIRSIGSGNIGATNVLRTGRKGLAAATLLLDMAKGAGAVGVGYLIFPEFKVWAGVAAFLGHLYPLWLKFRGGKGVATFIGVMLGASPAVGALVCVTWVSAAFLGRISSLSALTAALLAPVFAWFLDQQVLILPAVLMTLLIFVKHRSNIARLIAGTEPKIGGGSDETPSTDS